MTGNKQFNSKEIPGLASKWRMTGVSWPPVGLISFAIDLKTPVWSPEPRFALVLYTLDLWITVIMAKEGCLHCFRPPPGPAIPSTLDRRHPPMKKWCVNDADFLAKIFFPTLVFSSPSFFRTTRKHRFYNCPTHHRFLPLNALSKKILSPSYSFPHIEFSLGGAIDFSPEIELEASHLYPVFCCHFSITNSSFWGANAI